MGILSPTVTIVKYRVEGEIKDSVADRIEKGLVSFAFNESVNTKGWTSTRTPYNADFTNSNFLVGDTIVFSLRIDTKVIPGKVLKQHMTVEIETRLQNTGKEFISKSEKQRIKEQISEMLIKQIPAIPNIFDILWDYENKELYFFTTQNGANLELETLFTKSFGLLLIKLFPFTIADLTLGLSDQEKDRLYKLKPTNFKESL
jgi:DNA recombination-dependent growth factor C